MLSCDDTDAVAQSDNAPYEHAELKSVGSIPTNTDIDIHDQVLHRMLYSMPCMYSTVLYHVLLHD